MANQIVVLVRQGIDNYLNEAHLYFAQEQDRETGDVSYSLQEITENPFAS
jgi:hypothetical protein